VKAVKSKDKVDVSLRYVVVTHHRDSLIRNKCACYVSANQRGGVIKHGLAVSDVKLQEYRV